MTGEQLQNLLRIIRWEETQTSLQGASSQFAHNAFIFCQGPLHELEALFDNLEAWVGLHIHLQHGAHEMEVTI